jgi:hypothetical protein
VYEVRRICQKIRRMSVSGDLENREAQSAEDPVKDNSPVVLTERDLAVFQFIHEQRYVCYNQIKDGFWKERSPDANACWHRVGKLVNAGYLTKEYSGKQGTDAYFASNAAVEVLKTKGMDGGLKVVEPTPCFDKNISHDLHVNNLRILFREIGLYQWTSERILIERDHSFQRPDAVLTIRGRRIALEFENGLTKGRERYRDLFGYYDRCESYRLLFVIVRGDTRDWLVELDYDARKTWFVDYKKLIKEREKVLFANKRGEFELSRLL